jgi:hypothetical protein
MERKTLPGLFRWRRARSALGAGSYAILGPCYLDIFHAKDIEIASNVLTSILRTKSRTLR